MYCAVLFACYGGSAPLEAALVGTAGMCPLNGSALIAPPVTMLPQPVGQYSAVFRTPLVTPSVASEVSQFMYTVTRSDGPFILSQSHSEEATSAPMVLDANSYVANLSRLFAFLQGTHFYLLPHESGLIKIQTGPSHGQYFFDFLDKQAHNEHLFKKGVKKTRQYLKREFGAYTRSLQSNFDRHVKAMEAHGCNLLKSKTVWNAVCGVGGLLSEAALTLLLSFENTPNPALHADEDEDVLANIEIIPFKKPLQYPTVIRFR